MLGTSDHAVTVTYVRAMERLVRVVQDLAQVRSLSGIVDVVRHAARDLTGADGATFVLRDGNQCYYAEENAISPLWKGKRFPMSACISGWVMLNSTPAIIEDIYSDPRIPADAYRPTFVKSLVMMPVGRSEPVAAIGNYWATRRRPAEEEVAILQALADTTSVAIQNAHLYADLQTNVTSLAASRQRIKEQHDALGVFTRALAHDLREPVRTIRAFSEMLLTDPDPSVADGSLLRHISEAGTRMGMLIDDVFAYTRLEDPRQVAKERVDLGAVLQDALGNLAQLIRERRAVITSDRLPSVEGNRTQLVAVFQNLIANAIAHNSAAVRIHVGLRDRDGETHIVVRDNGSGIPAEYLQSIFEPFKRLRRDDSHSGLGLAICRKVIETHGGRLGCESTPGQGATFFFTLPGLSSAAPRETGERVRGADSLDNSLARVLVVDDRVPDLLLARKVLLGRRGIQCDCVEANDGEEGLATLRSAGARGKDIDLVLLDINMPGMDGFSMLERMAADEQLREIPVVMHSGSTCDTDMNRARDLGAVGYLLKPGRPTDLRPILASVPTLTVQEDVSGRLSLLRADRSA